MDVSALFNAMPGAIAQGLIWGIMAIGVYITFRILDIADLSVDGTMCTGAAVCIMLMQKGYHVAAAMAIATLAGMLVGLVTDDGNSGDLSRYSDTAWSVGSEPEDHGKGKSADQCGQI